MKLDWRDWAVFAVVVCVIALALFYPWSVSAQGIKIHTSVDTYQRDIPQTVEDGQRLSSGLADILNAVIAQYEADNADAAAKVKAIMDGNQAALKASKKAQSALGGVPGGVLAKTLALGIYAARNPLGTIGGAYAGGGASVTWDAFNLFLVTGRAGAAWSPQVHPEVSLAAEWWLF